MRGCPNWVNTSRKAKLSDSLARKYQGYRSLKYLVTYRSMRTRRYFVLLLRTHTQFNMRMAGMLKNEYSGACAEHLIALLAEVMLHA